MTEDSTGQNPGQQAPPPSGGQGPDPDILRFLTIAFGVLLIAVGISFLGGLSIWRTLEFLSPVRRYWGDIRQLLVGGALLIGGVTLIVYRDRLKLKLPSGGRRIYRSREHKMVSGVFGGLAEYLDTDPTLLRLLAVAVAVLFDFWPVFVGYVVAAVVIPQEPESATGPFQPPAGS